MLLWLPSCLFAQKVTKVLATYTYIAPDNVRKTVDELTPKIKAVPDDMAVSIKGPAIKKGNFPAPRAINGDSLADME